MKYLTAKDVVAAKLMLDLERELDHMAEVGEGLHVLIGRLAAQAGADQTFLVEGQKLDGLVQHMGEISGFCRRIAEQINLVGFGSQAVAAAAVQVRLSTVGDRLSATGCGSMLQTPGECELW